MSSSVENILKIEGVKAKGFGIIPKIAMKDKRLTIEAKAIYSYFCSYAGAGTTAFPSIKLIISDLGISKDRYYRHFGLLKKYGYVKTEQKNKDGKFEQNIYTLVEKPQEIPNDQPSPQNNETESEPIPHFKDTENKESDRPCPYFTDTQIPYTQNKESNNNSIYKINSYLKSSINPSEEGQTDVIHKDDDKLLKDILENAQVNVFFPKEREFISNVISKLYYSKSFKLNGAALNQKEIRQELSKLNISVLDYAMMNYKKTKDTTRITKPESYFMSVLLNSIRDVQAENIRLS